MEGVYGRTWYLGEEGGLRKCKGTVEGIQRKDECRSKETREDRHGKRERLGKRRITGEVYGKDVVWVGWWKVWGGIFEEVGEELAKMEVSFSGGETLKER